MRVRELVHKARLTDAGLADNRNHLAPAFDGKLVRPPELLELSSASHKSREAAAGRCVEAGRRGAYSGDFKHLERLGETLHRHGPQGAHRHEALDEVQGSWGHDDGPREGELLHARGEMGGLADGGVVHAQITADRAYDDVTR